MVKARVSAAEWLVATRVWMLAIQAAPSKRADAPRKAEELTTAMQEHQAVEAALAGGG